MILSGAPVISFLFRFLFQDSSASKVDTSVSFPLALPSSSLTTDITHKPPPLCDLVLTGCVCHFGSKLQKTYMYQGGVVPTSCVVTTKIFLAFLIFWGFKTHLKYSLN